jgi:hypothetical protein
MIRRREFIALVGGAAAWPLVARAQQQGKVWRVGVLSIGSAATARHLVEAFFKGMADLGYQEGRNVHYEVRYGEGSFEKFEQYAREHVDDNAGDDNFLPSWDRTGSEVPLRDSGESAGELVGRPRYPPSG